MLEPLDGSIFNDVSQYLYGIARCWAITLKLRNLIEMSIE